MGKDTNERFREEVNKRLKMYDGNTGKDTTLDYQRYVAIKYIVNLLSGDFTKGKISTEEKYEIALMHLNEILPIRGRDEKAFHFNVNCILEDFLREPISRSTITRIYDRVKKCIEAEYGYFTKDLLRDTHIFPIMINPGNSEYVLHYTGLCERWNDQLGNYETYLNIAI